MPLQKLSRQNVQQRKKWQTFTKYVFRSGDGAVSVSCLLPFDVGRDLSVVVGTTCLSFPFIFLSLNNKKPEPYTRPNSCFTACCLTIFNIYFLNVLRTPPTHTTPAFSDLKVDVYGMKGGRLWDERWTFMG